MADLKFYFDESVALAVSEQVILVGLDAVSVHSLGTLGDSDQEHLQRACEMSRAICTCDSDFLILAQEGIEHAGIVFGAMQHCTIGDWVHYLIRLHATTSAEQAAGSVYFVERRTR